MRFEARLGEIDPLPANNSARFHSSAEISNPSTGCVHRLLCCILDSANAKT
jgi:hypothetical protein